MPRKATRAKREKFDQIDSLSVLEDSERVDSKSLHITMNRITILQTGKKLEKICEGLRDPACFEEKILELEELKDMYIRVGSGS